MMMKFPLTFTILLLCAVLNGQNYQAAHGSSFAGSLGTANNPASIVHVPFKWDITPLAIQAKHSTNAFVVNNFSLLSPRGDASAEILPGRKERILIANQDIRVLNTRIRINENSAFAFGAAIRSYQSVKTSAFEWQDSIGSVRQFMAANIVNSPSGAEIRGMAWAEIFGAYARTVAVNDNGIFNAGLAIKINRGLGAGYITASGLYHAPGLIHNENGYILNNGQAEFGYSSNFNIWDSAGTNEQKRKRFLQKTWSSVSFSAGAEYIIPSGYDDDYYTYDLKIGASLLDIGYNKFQYSPDSRNAILNRGDISDSLIEATFENISGAGELPDSLASVAGSITQLSGFFKMFQPARLVIYADKHIAGNIFINAELSLPLIHLAGKNKLFVRDMNIAAITPRFETKSFGLYLPVTFNSRNQVWAGAAVKAGPLMLGMHNMASLFAKNKIQQGGAYLALTIRPWNKNNDEEDGAGKRSRGINRRGNKGGRMGCPANVQ